MKKFNFPYESLLKVRKVHEDLAQKDYVEALNKQRKAEKELQDMLDSIRSARQDRFMIQKQSGIADSNVQYIEKFIVGTKLKIQTKESEIESLKKVTQEKYDVFLLKHRDKKAIEKMKEKHLENFKKEYKKHQEKLADDLNMMRRARSE